MNTVSIPPPFRFNPWKHHLHWVEVCLNYVLNNPWDLKLRDGMIENVVSINSNYVDIYTGHLTAEQIIKGICDELKDLKIRDKSEFSSWICGCGFIPNQLYRKVWLVLATVCHESPSVASVASARSSYPWLCLACSFWLKQKDSGYPALE